MKNNTTKGNHIYSYSSPSPSFLSKIKSCFRPNKSSYPPSPPLLSGNYGVQKTTSPTTKPESHDKVNTKPSSTILSNLELHFKRHRTPSSSIPIIRKTPESDDKANTTIPNNPVPRCKDHTTPSSSSPTILKKPVSGDKANTTTSSSSPTIPNNPVPHYKDHTTPSSSSPTILKKPVSQHTVPPADSKQNTDPSMSQAAWTLAAGAGKLATGAGKLAFLLGKKAALVTTEVVKGGIESAAHQIEHNEKLKETFACYYTDRNGTAYQGTLNFSNNQIIFSTDLPSHTTNENRKPPILPPGSSYKPKESELKLELKISFREVIEINQVNAENPSTRYIQIRREGSNYAFRGFVDYYKAYNHIYSLLQSSSNLQSLP